MNDRGTDVVVIVDDPGLFADDSALLLTRGKLFTIDGRTAFVEEATDLVAACDGRPGHRRPAHATAWRGGGDPAYEETPPDRWGKAG